MVHLSELHEKYGGRFQFLFVYVREVGMGRMGHHPFPEALREFEEPAGSPPGSRLRLEARVRAGRKHYHLSFPCLIDNEKGEVETLFNAWPKRLMIVDSAGRIVLDPGNLVSAPFPLKAITDWLDRYSESVSP